MNFIQKAVVGLITVASLVIPVEAKTPDTNFQDHVALAEAIEKAGIDFQLNPPECAEQRGTYGWYYAAGKQLVVCQVNAKVYQFGEYEWTPEDLDTLRHEAHHMVQDCMDGRLDGHLTTVYQGFPAIVKQQLDYEMIAQIIKVYSDLSDHQIAMELEAFAVASMDDAQEQLSDIQRYCL